MMVLGQDVDAVTFDMDGTLYSGARAVLRAIPRVWKHRRLLRRYYRIREEIRKDGVTGDLRKLQADMTAARMGLDPFETRLLIDDLVYGVWVDALERRDLIPGVAEFLSRLRAKGLKVGVVSDYPVEDKLMRLGLFFQPWHALADCEEVGALKPAPAVFALAAQRLGALPARILHIGDREDCDVAGAHAAGMNAALVVRGFQKRRYRKRGTAAEAVVFDYREVTV